MGLSPRNPVSPDLLFVYGTLRPGARSPMTRFLVTNAALLCPARYRGRIYRIAHYPGVVPSDNPRDRVIGDVFRLAHPPRVLKRLDIHEGCGPAARRPTEYVREVVTVELEEGGPADVWTYLYNWPIEPSALIRSGDFLARR
jgi:gamma-glutamylcyclotransferase (GGCT)/AIG2-like uncharacterized protein YtfP